MLKSLLFILLAVVLAGCRQSAQPTTNADVSIAFSAEALTVGTTTVTVTLTTASGAPLVAQSVDIRGDMTHPGMTPVLVDTLAGNASGVYTVPFEWTMGGEWQVTVTVTLPDGTTAAQTFDLNIRS